ncbi:MAG TPA: serine hydrolase domain-containing protein [Parasegetibacter sp.]
MKKYFLAGLFAVILISSGYAQSRSLADTLKQLDSLFIHWNTSTPGGSLSISRGGKIIYHKTGGMADLEHHIAISDETLFEAGSVSKQFTATAILMLAEEGKLSLDDDVRKYIPQLPDYGSKITIKHLLWHTSGLKDWGSVAVIGGWPRTTRAYTQDHAREIIYRQKTLNFPPGTEYSYSNSNYTLLTTLVEIISGESFASFTKKRILDPVGMKRSQWRDDFRKIVPNRSVAYEKERGEYKQNMPFEYTHGHSALLTTTQELLTWLQYWSTGKFGESLLKLRETQGITNDGKTIDYALGAVRITKVNGYREVSHSGATAGYRAWLAYYPEKDLSVAYLSNDGSTTPTSAMGKKVAEIFLGKEIATNTKDPDPKPQPFVPESATLKSYEGKYFSEEADAYFTVQVKGNSLTLFRNPATTLNLTAVEADKFTTVNGIQVEFKRSKNKVTGFTVSVERARNIVFNKL